MRRYAGWKKRRMRAPITRAVAAMAPRTSSGNASSPAGVYLKVVRRTILGGKGLGRGIGHRLRGGMKTDRGRIKTYVRSLDDILGGGLPAGFVVLLNGAPGTMKSSFAFSILYQNALREGRKSAYFTLEQGKDLTLEHMASLGMADERAAPNITTLDMGNIRKNLNYLRGGAPGSSSSRCIAIT